jgi:hypothetical protein
MGFKEVTSLDADTVVSVGGRDKKTGKANPTSVEGYYLGFRTVENKKGEGKIHIFQTAKGNLGVWGKTDSDRKLSGIALGTMTRLSFKGMKPTPNGDMYAYVVEVDTDNTIEVADLSAGAGNETGIETGGYDDGGDEDLGEETAEEYTDGADEDAAQEAALAAAAKVAAERKAKVQALLKNKKA